MNELNALRTKIHESTKLTPLLLTGGKHEKLVFREFIVGYYAPILHELD